MPETCSLQCTVPIGSAYFLATTVGKALASKRMISSEVPGIRGRHRPARPSENTTSFASAARGAAGFRRSRACGARRRVESIDSAMRRKPTPLPRMRLISTPYKPFAGHVF